MIRSFLLFVSLLAPLFAAEVDANVTQEQLNKEKILLTLKQEYKKLKDEGAQIKSIWLNAYENHQTYKKVLASLVKTKKQLKQLKRKHRTKKRREEIKRLEKEVETLNKQLMLLPQKSDEPFDELLKAQPIPKEPEISNPFAIFTGFSYTKTLTQIKEEYAQKEEQLKKVYELFSRQEVVLSELYQLTDSKGRYKEEYEKLKAKVQAFQNALHVIRSTNEVYSKRIDDLIFKTNFAIQEQAMSLLRIVIVIVVLFIIAFLIKMVVKKYVKDHERFYMANKIINFVNFLIIVLILTANYIENMGYLVTVLGFASAGIAIALKDWFMSVLGWLVIVVGGSIHVGDRIKFQKDGMEYVGDVLDISLLRITILEDITLTTYMHNRRAGRIFFIPNNYVFTSMIANYSHHSLKTVWDGIDITITFESNHKKAAYLAKEITRKYSKGYTDITRKQLNKLRDRYSLKNTNVEPRIFTFIEPNGIKISSWYLTNAYATLTLRSTISAEIVDAFLKEDDITIAYPTQRIHMGDQESPKPPAELPVV